MCEMKLNKIMIDNFFINMDIHNKVIQTENEDRFVLLVKRFKLFLKLIGRDIKLYENMNTYDYFIQDIHWFDFNNGRYEILHNYDRISNLIYNLFYENKSFIRFYDLKNITLKSLLQLFNCYC